MKLTQNERRRMYLAQREARQAMLDRLKQPAPVDPVVSTSVIRRRWLKTVAIAEGKRQAEDQLRAREARYRALIEGALDIIIVADAQGTILYASQAASRMLGLDPGHLVGRNSFDFVHPDDLGVVSESWEQGRDFLSKVSAILPLDEEIAAFTGDYLWWVNTQFFKEFHAAEA